MSKTVKREKKANKAREKQASSQNASSINTASSLGGKVGTSESKPSGAVDLQSSDVAAALKKECRGSCVKDAACTCKSCLQMRATLERQVREDIARVSAKLDGPNLETHIPSAFTLKNIPQGPITSDTPNNVLPNTATTPSTDKTATLGSEESKTAGVSSVKQENARRPFRHPIKSADTNATSSIPLVSKPAGPDSVASSKESKTSDTTPGGQSKLIITIKNGESATKSQSSTGDSQNNDSSSPTPCRHPQRPPVSSNTPTRTPIGQTVRKRTGLGCSYNCCVEKNEIVPVDSSIIKTSSSYMQALPETQIDSEMDVNNEFFTDSVVDYLQQERRTLIRQFVICTNKREKIIAKSKEISERTRLAEESAAKIQETPTDQTTALPVAPKRITTTTPKPADSTSKDTTVTCSCDECLKKRGTTQTLLNILGHDCKPQLTENRTTAPTDGKDAPHTHHAPCSSSTGSNSNSSLTDRDFEKIEERVLTLVEVFGCKSEADACYDKQFLEIARKVMNSIATEEYEKEETRLHNEYIVKYRHLENKRKDINNRIDKCMRVMRWAGENEEYMLEMASDEERELLASIMMQEQQLQEALKDLPPEPLPQPEFIVHLPTVESRIEKRAHIAMEKLVNEFRTKHIKLALGIWQPEELFSVKSTSSLPTV